MKYFKTSILSFALFSACLSWAIPHRPGNSVVSCDPQLNKSFKYSPVPVNGPDLRKLPFTCDGKVKVFELRAEEVFTLFHKGFEPGPLLTWGYNGSNPGPIIEALEGETIRVKFTNNLPEATTVHWHGIELPIEMDGATGHSHPPVMPGKSYTYEFPLIQSGTYMYHSGHAIAKQLAMGLSGFFVIHPKKKPEIMVERDYLMFLQMWTIPPHSVIPDTMDMMFNFFTINGKTAPSTTPLNVNMGEKVRIRIGNISMMQHPIHLHGHTWKVVATGSGDNPSTAWTLGNTILVPVGGTRDLIIENVEEPGDWLLHCHLPHHVTNNMEIDPVPGEPMDHGEAGMFTIFKVPKMGGGRPPHGGPPHMGDHNTSIEGDHPPGHKMVMGPEIGVYKGSLILSNGKKLKAELDLHKVQEDGHWRKLKAYLKIKMGDEYVLYNYENIRYNFETGTLYFDDIEKGLQLHEVKFMAHSPKMKMLHGRLLSEYQGIEGKLALNLSNGMHHMEKPTQNFEASISGEYLGSLDSTDSILQIEIARGLGEEELKESNPYYQYKFAGRVGLKKGDSYRFEYKIEGGSFDPFSGRLELRLNRLDQMRILVCQVARKEMKQTLDCGDNKFSKKIMMDHHLMKKASFMFDKKLKGKKLNQHMPVDLMAGKYVGYLHQKETGKMRPMELLMIGKKYASKPMVLPTPRISSTLKLYLGKSLESKFVNYKFKERPWLDSSNQHTKGDSFFTMEGEQKIYFIINKWNSGALMGTLYHKEFGQIGPFKLDKSESLAKLDEKLTPVTDAPGQYLSDRVTLDLSIINKDDEDFSSSNTISALKVVGNLSNTLTRKIYPIENGTYNPFNEVLSLMLADGRIVTGKLGEDGLEAIVPAIGKRRARVKHYKKINLLKK
jgi:hypothetical protein